MKYKYAKVFRNLAQSNVKLIKHDYSPGQDDYYSFVKKQRDSGYRQIIITSELMVEIIKHYFLDRTFRISTIEFMIEDKTLENDVRTLLEKVLKDRGFFSQLIDKLKFLIEESSIDIKKIELNERNSSGNATFFYIQVNGIFGINEERFEIESKYLLDFLEGCI